jgi:hypothetical protein
MSPFFMQLRYVADVLKASKGRLDAGPESASRSAEKAELAQNKTTVIMQIVVSLIVLIGGPTLVVVLRDPNIDKLVFAVIGTVVGYWLR